MDPYNIIVQALNLGKIIQHNNIINIIFQNINYEYRVSLTPGNAVGGRIEIAPERKTRANHNTDQYFSTDFHVPYDQILTMVRTFMKNFYVTSISIWSDHIGDGNITLFECDEKDCPGYSAIKSGAIGIIQRKVKARHTKKVESAQKIQSALNKSKEFVKWKYHPSRMKNTFEEWENESNNELK